MTADIIRNLLSSSPMSQEQLPALQCEILKELAAQVAELNEHMSDIAKLARLKTAEYGE